MLHISAYVLSKFRPLCPWSWEFLILSVHFTDTYADMQVFLLGYGFPVSNNSEQTVHFAHFRLLFARQKSGDCFL